MQRVLLALALEPEPELLLLDEPAAGIDVPGQEQFYELIQRVNRERGTTILAVSHDINMVAKHAHQVMCLKDGIIHCQAPPREITPEMLAQVFGAQHARCSCTITIIEPQTPRSHAPRGNASPDALRPVNDSVPLPTLSSDACSVNRICERTLGRDAERPDVRSHAERGNEGQNKSGVARPCYAANRNPTFVDQWLSKNSELFNSAINIRHRIAQASLSCRRVRGMASSGGFHLRAGDGTTPSCTAI